MFPYFPQSSLGILRVPQLPLPLNTPPVRTLQLVGWNDLLFRLAPDFWLPQQHNVFGRKSPSPRHSNVKKSWYPRQTQLHLVSTHTSTLQSTQKEKTFRYKLLKKKHNICQKPIKKKRLFPTMRCVFFSPSTHEVTPIAWLVPASSAWTA